MILIFDLATYKHGWKTKTEQLNDYDFEMPQTLYNYRVSYNYICATNEFTYKYLPYLVSDIFSVHNLTRKQSYMYILCFVHLVFGPIYSVCNAIVCNTIYL